MTTSARPEPGTTWQRSIHKLLTLAVVTATLGNMIPGLYAAEPWLFNPREYQALADADSPDTIPVGTRIGLNNWRQYKKFLPIGIQALFSQNYQWRIPPGPDWEMVVGPTIPVPLPYDYQRDTEKYAQSVKLERSAGGELTMSHYVAGLPFPKLDRADPDYPYKVIYDEYFTYRPALQLNRFKTSIYDVYLNSTDTEVLTIFGKLNHVSDEGFATFNAAAPSEYLFAIYTMIELPEQSRYTTQLSLYYSDPNRMQEVYSYVPSLRRSLRMSSAARCAPVEGTDFLTDDLNTRPVRLSDFSYRVLGEKKVLLQIHMDPARAGDDRFYNYSGVPGWPKPTIGPWELRKVWLVEETPLPTYKDYCYGTRIAYVDTDFFYANTTDLYDPRQTLWKVFNNGVGAGPLGDSHGSVVTYAAIRSAVLDLQSSHASVTHILGVSLFNNQVPEKYHDPQNWALPSALHQIGR